MHYMCRTLHNHLLSHRIFTCKIYNHFIRYTSKHSFIQYPTSAMAVSLQSKEDNMKYVKPEQKFQYLLVLDFEATCKDREKIEPQEIIEFPVLKLNTKTCKVEAQFHEYVQPRVHKNLTAFCTELTGITQEEVDAGIYIEDALKRFNQWMIDNSLLEEGASYAFVTYGDWDLKTMLPHNCDYFKIPVPGYFKKWINVKKCVAKATGKYPGGMMGALKQLKLTHIGHHHSGIDDCKNISNIVVELIKLGYVFDITGSR